MDHMLSTTQPDTEPEEGRVVNQEAITKIREAWIFKQLAQRQSEFTTFSSINLFIGTWNVNAKKLDFDDPNLLTSWLFPPENNGVLPDIVAVGFQEIVDLNAVNVAVDSKAKQRSELWQEQIHKCLNTKTSYTLISEVHLVGMLLCVYVKNTHIAKVSNVHSETVGVGVMGVMGNKGGVSVRMSFYDSSICFVCSHFAAHRENVAGRNADFASILNKTSFDIGKEAVQEAVRAGSVSQWASGSSAIGLKDHDFVFWLGDLNYRIDETLSTDEVFVKSNNMEIETLRAHDQLNIERFNNNVFEGFEEGVLKFAPTYKYQPNTDLYECRPDKKLRAPAWCDRVLWLSQNPAHVSQKNYLRSELNISDHKPVMATFTTQVKNILAEKRQEVYGEVMRTLDKFENQSLPKVNLNKIDVDFGELYYENKSSESLLVTNSGKVVAHFRLVPKLEDEGLCKDWISVSPTFGMLIPGESMTINFSINLDNKTAQQLNLGRESLDDIIILRLENGRDHYLTVSGKYARSCFGMSLRDLVVIGEPVRDLPLEPEARAEFEKKHPPSSLSVPKELWRIVDAINEKGLHEKDLFLQPGFAAEVKQIRECLDTSSDFGLFHVHSMCEALVSFLSSLSEPLIPSFSTPIVEIDQQNIMPWSRRFLEELPPIHYNCFVYIISFLREVLLFSKNNGLTAAKLARVCSNCMIQSDGGKNEVGRSRSMALIFLHFLTTNTLRCNRSLRGKS
ncbi:hypothetical protein TrLO_g4041 [Triparma laevis f. longispina]|uniref:Rho-GAP domain-containing protein n=1 Tax=Triparma laevis f. longispina TaxID=1714387 RepID=A0A9W7AYH5_9STRA|nr:hypothetical protein TrLO_g4041 [Triparma laevis f. longispina]